MERGAVPPLKGCWAAGPAPPRRSRAVAMATEALPRRARGRAGCARARGPAAPGAGAKGRARRRRAGGSRKPGTRRDRGGTAAEPSLPSPTRCPLPPPKQPLAPGERGGGGPPLRPVPPRPRGGGVRS